MMKFKIGKKEINVDSEVKIGFAKKALSFVAAYGAGVIIFSIISKHLPEGMKLHTRLAVALGSWAIINMGKDKVREYTDKTFDETLEFVETLKNVVQELKDEIEAQTIKTA